jgi:hypothetical protein
VFALCVIFFATVLAVFDARADCPRSFVTLGPDTLRGAEVPADTTARVDGHCWLHEVRMVPSEGRLGIYRSATCWFDEVTGSLQDEFRIVGPTPGTPINVSVRFDATGFLQDSCAGGGGGQYEYSLATLDVDGIERDRRQSSSGVVRSDVSFQLSAEVPVIVGAPLTIRVALSGWNSHSPCRAEIQLDGALRFDGLPAGAAAVSCLGYGPPTATRPTTWGALKAAYR